jgi:hypothetical protein
MQSDHPATLDVRMYWHARRDADPAHVWLRGVFDTLFAHPFP